MTYEEAQSHLEILSKIRQATLPDDSVWLSILEDELRSVLAPDSVLLAKFLEIKGNVVKESIPPLSEELSAPASRELRKRCDAIVEGAIYRLKLTQPKPDLLREKVDDAIHKGYFKSIYFRAIVIGLVSVVSLVTGVETMRLNKQIDAMDALVENARKEVAKNHDEIVNNGKEIAKSANDTRDRQAQFALSILQSKEDMVTLQTAATLEIKNQADRFQKDVGDIATTAKSRLEKTDLPAAQTVIKNAAEVGKSQIDDKVTKTLTSLDAKKSPWIPLIVWSAARTWLLVPLAVAMAFLAWCSTLFANANAGKGVRLVLASLNVALLAVSFVVILWIHSRA